MSRIGKKPIILPEGVSVSTKDNAIYVSGPKGELTMPEPRNIEVNINEKTVSLKLRRGKIDNNLYGLNRTLIDNMVHGVSEGFVKSLEMKGVGYRAEVKENILVLNLGFSHPVNFTIPEGITIDVKKNIININGCDKQLVGETAARIRRFRPPEPYKGKGIRYVDEIVRKKAGKAAKAAEGAAKVG